MFFIDKRNEEIEFFNFIYFTLNALSGRIPI